MQEKALDKSKAHKTVSAPEEKDVIANEKTDDDSRASKKKAREISMILMRKKSKKRDLVKEAENVELKNSLVRTC